MGAACSSSTTELRPAAHSAARGGRDVTKAAASEQRNTATSATSPMVTGDVRSTNGAGSPAVTEVIVTGPLRIGGGVNHRFGLFDMIMLKDNHLAGTGITAAAPGSRMWLKSSALAAK